MKYYRWKKLPACSWLLAGALLCIAFAGTASAEQMVYEHYPRVLVPIGGSYTEAFTVSAAPSGALVTSIDVQFTYIAYNGVQTYVSSRINKGSDPGPTGGAVVVAQGSLPSSPSPGGTLGTYGFVSFSAWNGQAANGTYFVRFATAADCWPQYAPTIATVRLTVNYTVPVPPPSPVLSAPLDGSITTNTAPTLSWGYSGSVDYFHVQVAVTPVFATQDIVREDAHRVTASYALMPLTPNTYYWRVRSHGVNGSWSDWSIPFSLVIQAPPPATPVPDTPIDGAVLSNPQPAMAWNQSGNAAYFRVQVARDSVFSNIVIDQDHINAFNYTPASPLSDGAYWWRVRAYYGSYGDWSVVRGFSVLTTTPSPVLTNPPDGSVLDDPTPDLAWTEASGTSNYFAVQIARDAGFTDIAVDAPNVGAFNYTPSSLPDGSYWWRVRAHGTNGYWSPWATRSMTIAVVAVLPAPVLSAPQNVGDLPGAPYTFTWSPMSGAGAFQIKISMDNTFAAPIVNDQGIPGSSASYTYSGSLAWGVVHYWQMRTLNGAGTLWGDWSPVWSFIPRQADHPRPVFVPLYRLYKYDPGNNTRDHFYTTNRTERDNAVQTMGYVDEKVVVYVSDRPFIGGTPLYRLYRSGVNSHYYTMDLAEKNAKILAGYADEGIAAYVYGSPVDGLVSLRRLQQRNGDTTNHYFLTARKFEYDNVLATAAWGYMDDGIAGYVSPDGLQDPMAHNRPQGNYGGIDLGTGAFRGLDSVDLSVKGRGPSLSFSHYYNSANTGDYTMGPGWSNNVDSYAVEGIAGDVYVVWGDGSASYFQKTGTGITDFEDRTGAHDRLALVNDNTNYGYRITKTDQTIFEYRRLNVNPLPRRTGITDYTFPQTRICLISIQDWAGNKLTIDREAAYATPVSMRDGLGRELRFTYDLSRRLTSVGEYDPGGLKRSISFAYNPDGTLESFTDPREQVTRYAYDNSLLTFATYPEGNVFRVTYDASTQRTVSMQIGNDPVATVTYLPADNVTEVRDPAGKIFSFTHEQFNLTLQKAQIDYNPALFEYTDTRNPTRPTRIVDKGGNATSFVYDARGNVTRITNALGNIADYSYNDKNRLLSATVFHAPGDLSVVPTRYSYDLTGNQLETIVTPIGQTTAIHYDSHHQVDWVRDGRGFVTYFTYDAYGNLSQVRDPQGGIAGTTNDYAGRTTQAVDEDGKRTDSTYDAGGNLVSITDHLGNTVFMDHNNNGDLSRISWTRDGVLSETKYFYNAEGRLREVTNPLTLAKSVTYDGVGNVRTRIDNDGTTTSYFYDGNNRLDNVVYADHTNRITRNRNGSIQTVQGPQGTTGFTYTPLNDVASVSDPYLKTVQYRYDPAGRITRITYPDGRTADYTYDADGRLLTVKDPLGGVTEYAYDASGNLAEIRRPNGTRALYTYDSASRLTRISDVRMAGSTVIFSADYTLSAAGDITGISATEPLAQSIPAEDVSYAYDAANRLLTAGTASYTYSPNGNRLSRTRPGESITYQWDADNRLTQVSSPGKTVDHFYDGLGNRIARRSGSATTRYVLDLNVDMSRVLAETDASGNVTAWYVYGLGLISRIAADGSQRFYHFNNRGDTVALTDGQGMVTDSYAYDEYGKLAGSTGSTPNPFKFVGQHGVMDEGDDLYFMRARFYDAETGRFLSEDPLGFEGGDWNNYIYVKNDPVRNIDPSGLIFKWFFAFLNLSGSKTTQDAMQAGIEYSAAFERTQSSSGDKSLIEFSNAIKKRQYAIQKFAPMALENVTDIYNDTRTPTPSSGLSAAINIYSFISGRIKKTKSYKIFQGYFR